MLPVSKLSLLVLFQVMGNMNQSILRFALLTLCTQRREALTQQQNPPRGQQRRGKGRGERSDAALWVWNSNKILHRHTGAAENDTKLKVLYTDQTAGAVAQKTACRINVSTALKCQCHNKGTADIKVLFCLVFFLKQHFNELISTCDHILYKSNLCAFTSLNLVD